MAITTIALNDEEWAQFHDESEPDPVFFAIATALQRVGDGFVRPAQVPAIAHQAIVFHQAWHAYNGSYTWTNAFHGYTADNESKAGFLANVRAMRDFVRALGARDWEDALAVVIAAAEATPAAVWESNTNDGILDYRNDNPATRAMNADVFQAERLGALVDWDLLVQAAAYVRQTCPVTHVATPPRPGRRGGRP